MNFSGEINFCNTRLQNLPKQILRAFNGIDYRTGNAAGCGST